MAALATHHLAQNQAEPGAAARRTPIHPGHPVGLLGLAGRADQDLLPPGNGAAPGPFALVGVVRGTAAQQTSRDVRGGHRAMV
jgi:hypothetical protein